MMMNVCQGEMIIGSELWIGISESSTFVTNDSGIRTTTCKVHPCSRGGQLLCMFDGTHSYSLLETLLC